MSALVDCSQMWARAKQTEEYIRRTIETQTRVAAKEGVLEARSGPFQDRTGALRGTIRWDVLGWTGSTFKISIAAPMQYASFVEHGTSAHDIWPKAGYSAKVSSLKPGQTRRGRGKGPHEYVVGRGRALRWKNASGEHFAAMVHHLGSKPYRFMWPAQIQAVHTLRDGLRTGFVGLVQIWRE